MQRTMMIDGLLYTLMMMLTAALGGLAQDEAAKWIPDVTLFWMRWGMTIALAGVTGLKAFRSTSFSDVVNSNGTKPPLPAPPK